MLLILLVFINLSLLYLLLKRTSDYWMKRGIIQTYGVLFKFILSKRSMAEIYRDIYNNHPNESYIGTVIGINPTLIIKDLRDIQAVMQGNFENFHSRGIVSNPKDVLCDNILFMEDYNRWKLLRHKMAPIFTQMKVKNLFYTMERCARDLVKFVDSKQYVAENTFEMLSTYTTACVAASIFGIEAHSKDITDSPFLKMTHEALNPSLINNLKLTLAAISPTLFNFLNFKRFGKQEDFFLRTVKKVLEYRRNVQQERHDFVDLCLELQKQGAIKDSVTGYEIEATDEILAAQAFFFFLAGVDTSATVMHFALLELASSKDILKKVHKEIDKVFDDCDEKLTYDDIVYKLEYLEMVMFETLRKYPSIGVIQRFCTKSTILPVGQVRVEKGNAIIIPVFALHRDEKYYPNPTVFDPERFSTNNKAKIDNFNYLAFGGGNRRCIGVPNFIKIPSSDPDRLAIDLNGDYTHPNKTRIVKIGTNFARVQVKSGLAWLLRRFTLEEQKYVAKSFAPSFFSIRDKKANFKLIRR